MIVIDTSALMALLLGAPEADAVAAVLEEAPELAIPATTLAEARIKAAGHGLGLELEELVAGLGLAVLPVTAETARQVPEAYAAWGQGRRREGLSFAECFSYAAARAAGAPLLCTGEAFAGTGVTRALPR